MQTLAFSCAFISYILPVEWNDVWIKRQLLNALLTLWAPSLINFHTACWWVEIVGWLLCRGPRMWSFTAPSDVRGAACFIFSCCPTVLSWLFKEFVLMRPVLVGLVYNSSSLPHRGTFIWLILIWRRSAAARWCFSTSCLCSFYLLVAWKAVQNAENVIVVKELAPKRGFCLLEDTQLHPNHQNTVKTV